MRQPLIGQEQSGARLDVDFPAARTAGAASQKVLLGRRARGYLSAISGLDVHGAGRVDVADVHAAILEAFPPGAAVPLGLVTKCYLGPPFVVHILDLAGYIVQHYRLGETLPPPFESARTLALHPDYVAVEVYEDRLVTIRADGTTGDIARGTGASA